ncbi:hypothetical protein LTR15_009693 [Elasticomyces elasticus]|nr:hypothetical protein LTR15_009693 [Elasticomyces elasticus]
MATQYKKIAVAGAVGNLGPTVVQALVDAGFDVTILSRSGNTLPNTKSAKVDYGSKDSLVAALRGQDALVSNIPNHIDQPALIDAAIEAGVKHFIPSEFGSNVTGNSKVAALPVFAGKLATEEYLKQQSKISWTVIVNGLFFDWGLSMGILADLSGGTTKVYGDPDVKHSLTLLSDVAKAVVGVLQHPEETRNRTVYIQSTALSQNQILDVVRKHKAGGDVERVDTESLLQEGYSLLKKGGANIRTAMFNFILVSVLDKEYGNNWSEQNDNALLGIQELTADEIDKQIVSVLAEQERVSDELKSGIQLLESELEGVLDGLQSIQESLNTLGENLSRQRKKLERMRETQTAISSPNFDPNTDTVIDEKFRGSIKRIREKFRPEDIAPAMEHIRTEADRVIRNEEAILARDEALYSQQGKEQVGLLLKVKMAREMVDHAKEVLSGQPATYQTNVPGDEALPQAWRS